MGIDPDQRNKRIKFTVLRAQKFRLKQADNGYNTYLDSAKLL